MRGGCPEREPRARKIGGNSIIGIYNLPNFTLGHDTSDLLDHFPALERLSSAKVAALPAPPFALSVRWASRLRLHHQVD